MFCYLLSVILLTAFRGADAYKLTWPDDCEHHPLAIWAEAMNSKESSESSPTTCTLRFLVPQDLKELSTAVKEIRNETEKTEKESELGNRARDFCESMFYDEFDRYDLTEDEINCKYERYHHCPENQWAYSGKCYGWGETTMNKEGAVAACKSKGGDLMRVDAAHWLIKLNVFNEANFSRMWIDGRSTSFKDRDIQGPRGDHSAYRLSRDPESNYRPGYAETADPNEPLHFLCALEAKVYMYAYKKACQLINDVFRIPAAYHGGTCYFQSTNFQIAKAAKTTSENASPISVAHFHDSCSVLADSMSYAAVPSSITRKQGMNAVVKEMEKRKEANNLTFVDPIMLPGQRNVFQDSGVLLMKREEYMTQYEYVLPVTGKVTNKVPIYATYWEDGYPQKGTADMDDASLRLSYNKKMQVMNIPSFVRARVICANGFRAEDLEMNKCEDGWTASARDEGRMVCHKAFLMEDKNYNEAEAICTKEEAKLSPIQSFQEQLIVTKLALEKSGGSSGSAWIGAKRVNDTEVFVWTMGGEELDYNHWNKGEPSDHRGIEDCVQMYLSEKEGLWNDRPCDRVDFAGTGKGTKYYIIAGVCAKWATRPKLTPK